MPLPRPDFMRSVALERLGLLYVDVGPREVAWRAERLASAALAEAEARVGEEAAGVVIVYVGGWELHAWERRGEVLVAAEPGEPPQGEEVALEALASSSVVLEYMIEDYRRARARLHRAPRERLGEAVLGSLLAKPPKAPPRPPSTVLLGRCIDLYIAASRRAPEEPRDMLARWGVLVLARGADYACALRASLLRRYVPPNLKECPYIIARVVRGMLRLDCTPSLETAIGLIRELEEQGYAPPIPSPERRETRLGGGDHPWRGESGSSASSAGTASQSRYPGSGLRSWASRRGTPP